MIIEIEQLMPILVRGYVAMDKSGYWVSPNCNNYVVLSDCFRIKPVDDWTKSLRRCPK